MLPPLSIVWLMGFGNIFGFEIVAPEDPVFFDKWNSQSPSAPEERN